MLYKTEKSLTHNTIAVELLMLSGSLSEYRKYTIYRNNIYFHYTSINFLITGSLYLVIACNT